MSPFQKDRIAIVVRTSELVIVHEAAGVGMRVIGRNGACGCKTWYGAGPEPSHNLSGGTAGFGGLLPVAPGATFGRSCPEADLRNHRED